MAKTTIYRDKETGALYSLSKTGEKVPFDNPTAAPSASQSFSRGVMVEGPANLAGLADMALNKLDPGRNAPPGATPIRERSDIAGTIRNSPTLNKVFPQPTTPGGRLVQAAGAGVTESLPFAFLPGPGRAMAGAVMRDVSSGVAAEMARQVVAEAGGTPEAQQAISIGVGLTTAGGLGIAGRGASALGKRMSKPLAKVAADKAVMRSLGKVVDDPQLAKDLLDKELYTPLFGRATPEQILQAKFPGVSGLVTKDTLSPAMRSQIDDLKRSNAAAASDFLNRNLPAGRVTAAQQDYINKLERIDAKVKKAYGSVDGDIEGLPTTKLDAAAAWVRQDAGEELKDFLPSRQLKVIDGYEREVGYIAADRKLKELVGGGSIKRRELSFKQLDRLDKSINNDRRMAQRAGNDQAVRYLNKLKDAVEGTYDDLARETGMEDVLALRRAKKIFSVKKGRFGEKDPLNQILGEEFEDTGKKFTTFLNNHPKPAPILERAMKTHGGNPEAVLGIKRLTRDYVFGEGEETILKDGLLSPAGADKALKRLRHARSAFETVYGPGSAKNAEEFINRVKVLSSGKTAKVDRFSPVDVPKELDLEQAANVGEVSYSIRRAAMRTFKYLTGRLPNNQSEVEKLMGVFATDNHAARGFLEALPVDQVNHWKAHTLRAMAREGIRGTAGTDPRTEPVKVR